MGACPLGLQRALLLGGILDNSLGLVVTDLSALLESTASRGTQLPRLLGTSSDGGILLDTLLLNVAHLSRPLGALGEGGVTTGLIITLLILNSFTLNHIILNIMLLLLGPALRLILSSTDLRALHITVLDQGSSAHLHSLIEGNLLIVDETVLSEILLTFLLLLRLIIGDIGGVAPPVVGMVTLDNLIILSLLHHFHLVNAPLASCRCSSYSTEGHTVITLTISTGNQVGAGSSGRGWGNTLLMVVVVGMVLLIRVGIKRESVEQRPLSPLLLLDGFSSQL